MTDDHHIEMGAPLTVLAAYRVELSRRRGGATIGSHDARWITVGTLLSHADGQSTDERDRVMEEARRVTRDALGDAQWTRGSVLDAEAPLNAHDISPRMRLLCEQIEDAGAFTLAETILATYVRADLTISPLERGRLDALRARLAWKRGEHAMAEAIVSKCRTRSAAPTFVRASCAGVYRIRGSRASARKLAGLTHIRGSCRATRADPWADATRRARSSNVDVRCGHRW